jgi:hypothetical protein
VTELERAEQTTARARAALLRMPNRQRLAQLLAATRAEAIARIRAHGHHTAANHLDTQETP